MLSAVVTRTLCAGSTAGESVWQLPAVRHEGGETIRQTAERAAAATLPDGLKVTSSNVSTCGTPDRALSLV